MSDYLAVAGVTAVLKTLLEDALMNGGPSGILHSAGITAKAPDLIDTGPDEAAQINLFMYYSSLNAAYRNVDLPAFDSRGQKLTNPPLALNLHYLISAYGGQDFDGEILLAWAMQVFHENPILTAAGIQDRLNDLSAGLNPSSEVKLLLTTNLVNQVESIKISPEALSNDEINKLWMAFQTHYRPTTSYQASVVLIRSNSPVRSNLPVQSRNVLAIPWQPPIVQSVQPSTITTGGQLTIVGRNFLGSAASDTLVQFDGSDPIAADSVQNNCVRVTAPIALRSGVHTIRIVRNVSFGAKTDPHRGFTSNTTQFLLAPTIQNIAPTSVAFGSTLNVTIKPPVGRTQDASVLIGNDSVGRAPPLPGDPDILQTLSFVIPDTIAYTSPPVPVPLRVQIDGVQSLLTLDTSQTSSTFGQYLPQVEVTGP
ncbi:MAG TPA: DUF4255 domain-containing protein [Tepidisphaeraceae bacterium]|jgi:hypothetical protein|nr:DUF4255 domain-containing protein [Tepidisphaeraceae bacterium]